MRDKIGMPLDEIHLSGDVPRCKSTFSANVLLFNDALLWQSRRNSNSA